MKTTIEISDALLKQAKRRAAASGSTLRQLVEDGLRRVLEDKATPRFVLPDCRVGTPGGENPLAGLSWSELRDEIYGAKR